jgi:hypothetical protein
VTDDNTTLEFCGHLYSEPVVRRSDDGTVTLEWVHRGRTGTTLVSDPLIEEWVDTINAKVAAEAEVVSLRERLDELETALRGLLDAVVDCDDERYSNAFAAARRVLGDTKEDDSGPAEDPQPDEQAHHQ